MRILTILLTLVFCLGLVGTSFSATTNNVETSTSAFNVVLGASSYFQLYQKADDFAFKDNIGYSGGFVYNLSNYIGLAGFWDYVKTERAEEVEGIYKNDLAAYGTVSLFKWPLFEIHGLLGAEWSDNNTRAFVNTPGFAFGLLGKVPLNSKFNVYSTVTTTMAEKYAAAKVRLGIGYHLF